MVDSPRFDPVLNWGHILIFAGVVMSGLGIVIGYRLESEVRAATFESRLHYLEISEERNGQLIDKIEDHMNSIKNDVSFILAKLPPIAPDGNGIPGHER